MSKSQKMIPESVKADLLSEMDELQIMGGRSEDDVHVYAVESCKSDSSMKICKFFS